MGEEMKFSNLIVLFLTCLFLSSADVWSANTTYPSVNLECGGSVTGCRMCITQSQATGDRVCSAPFSANNSEMVNQIGYLAQQSNTKLTIPEANFDALHYTASIKSRACADSVLAIQELQRQVEGIEKSRKYNSCPSDGSLTHPKAAAATR